MLLFLKLVDETQISKTHEATRHNNSTKLSILLLLKAIQFHSFQNDIPSRSLKHFVHRKSNQFELNSLVVQIIVTYYLFQEILHFAKMFYLDFELLIKRKTPQKRHVFLSLIPNSRRYLSINLCLKNLAVPLLTVVHPIFQEMKSLKYS